MTRRDAIRRAAAAGLVPLAMPARAGALTLDDLKKLERIAVAKAVAAEQTAKVAFEAIANSGVLDARTTATMRVLLDHASQHADLLEQTYTSELGDDPPLPPKRTAIAGLSTARSQPAALHLATGLEERAIAAHLGAVRRTHNAQLLKLIAGVVGSDGQSLVLLRQLLSRPAVPSAFERGLA
jgi:DNA-binding NarL/FixJ family response regulator